MTSATPEQDGRTVPGAPFLERALLLTILAHVTAMLTMLLLLPGLPGGSHKELTARAAYVAAHPWLWRLGWFGWQITAASDLLLAIALLRTSWIPRIPAIATLIITIAAIVPDQSGQFIWAWIGTSIAQRAVASADYSVYQAFESRIFLRIAGWATFGYIAGALAWTWCFAAARVWCKSLTLISWIVWPLFTVVTAMLFLPSSISQLPWVAPFVGLGNAVGFVLLLLWLMLVAELVLRRSRPVTVSGRHAPFRHPSTGIIGRTSSVLANSRLARNFFELLPALAMDSDITDVIYVNYLIEADRVAHFVQEPLELQRLGPDGRYALFTFLTFRHGHFGPRCFGPLRPCWPSPIQSNWRIHVFDPQTGKRGVQFLTIAITGTPYALASRLLAENVPMHIAREATLCRNNDGDFSLRIDPGAGTAPDVHATFRLSSPPELSEPWNQCFKDWQDFLAYCVPQDRAMSVQPWRNRIVRQEIDLGIPLDACVPLSGTVNSKAADAIAGGVTPLRFLVERVSFHLLKECYDPIP